MGANLKAFVRLDANERVVPGSLVLRKSKPRNGRWYEIPANTCCGSSGAVTISLFGVDTTTLTTATVTVGCETNVASGVVLTLSGANDAARRADLVDQLNALFGSMGSFALDSNDLTFTSSSTCLDPTFSIVFA